MKLLGSPMVVSFLAVLTAAVDASTTEKGHLRTRLYPEEEILEDAVESYFTVFQSEMSMTTGPSWTPSATPSLLDESAFPSLSPSQVTERPSNSPTLLRSLSPSEFPSSNPSVSTGAPSETLTDNPSVIPTDMPTGSPSEMPTSVESQTPSEQPSSVPTMIQTSGLPSTEPSVFGTDSPSTNPSGSPSTTITAAPTLIPSIAPTFNPSESPSVEPTPRCNTPESDRATLISLLIRTVSSSADVDTPGTPQNLAAEWLIDLDPLYICPQDDNMLQRYIMAVFYYSTRGVRWVQCSAPSDFEDQSAIDAANADCRILAPGGSSDAWLTPSQECDWGGVVCNEDRRMDRIIFERNGIAGTIPAEIGRLESLRSLALEEGAMIGAIPSELGEVRGLERLDLNFNLLNGTVPEEIYTLTNLRELDLNDNGLKGTISTSVGNFGQLRFLQLENNEFVGTIPSQLGLLGTLEAATFENNMLSGIMPVEVCANVAGSLVNLTSDCLGGPNRPSPPFVQCDCCTTCF